MIQLYLNKVHENIISNIAESKIKNPSVNKLYDSLLYYFAKKGKMLRPKLMLTIGKDIKANLDYITEFSTSLEMIHNYSLIHDDLPSMDNDDYRRGRLTLHKKYSESTAILAGDYLLNEAFNYILNNEVLKNSNTDTTLAATGYLACKTNSFGMLGGQIMDLDNAILNSYDQLLMMYEYKTSALFQCSTAIPAILMGINKDRLKEFEEVGRLFGIIFQFLDDIDDYEQDKKVQKINIFSFKEIEDINELIVEYKTKLFFLLNKLNLDETKLLIGEYLGAI